MTVPQWWKDYKRGWGRGALIALNIGVALFAAAVIGMLVIGAALLLLKPVWEPPLSDGHYMRIGMLIAEIVLAPYFLSRIHEDGDLDPDRMKRG